MNNKFKYLIPALLELKGSGVYIELQQPPIGRATLRIWNDLDSYIAKYPDECDEIYKIDPLTVYAEEIMKSNKELEKRYDEFIRTYR